MKGENAQFSIFNAHLKGKMKNVKIEKSLHAMIQL